MLILRGAPALSAFRKKRLLQACQKLDSSIQDIHAHFIHFIDTESELSAEELAVLDQLLIYGPSRVILPKVTIYCWWFHVPARFRPGHQKRPISPITVV